VSGVLDHEAKGSLIAALSRDPEVVCAWLFGSQASGRPGRLADVDLALLLRPGLRGRGVHRADAVWCARAQAVLGRDDVDVVLLDEAPPLLRFRAIQGELLTVNHRAGYVAFVSRTVWDHADMAPFRRVQDRALRARLSRPEREASHG
jgi:predicted nucleotidyltransferase